MLRNSLIVGCLLCVFGCGGTGNAVAPPTLPVKGKVTLKGQALKKGTITFEPDSGGKEAFGKVQPDGTFVLTSYKENDGAVPGVHRVYISGVSKNEVPAKYHSAAASKIEIEVSASKTDYDIDFK
jgi:hypothetical protein